jgi:hypothetical protein
MKWIQDHGVEAAVGFLAVLTGVLWGLTPATPFHAPNQQGRVNFPGLLLWLLLVAGSVGITLSVAEHCRGAVQAAFGPLVEQTPAHE